MLWVLLYLLVGFGNLVEAHKQGRLTPGWNPIEWAFYVLLWPVQAGFWMLVGINHVTGAILARIFR